MVYYHSQFVVRLISKNPLLQISRFNFYHRFVVGTGRDIYFHSRFQLDAIAWVIPCSFSSARLDDTKLSMEYYFLK